jgi:hypothetical protein
VVALAFLVKIEELLTDPERRRFAAQPEMDPLTEIDALQEAQLLSVRVDAVSSTVAVLFDLRTALQFMEGNTALIVARDVRDVSWSAEARPTARTAWNVVASQPNATEGLLSLSLAFVPQARLSLRTGEAEFYVGDVQDLPDAPPDYGSGDEAAIRAGVADWGSRFAPVHAVFLDAAPGSG